MPRTKPSQEVEIKLRVLDAGDARIRLKQARARMLIPRTFESNTLYDTPSGNLARQGKLIRIRIERACTTCPVNKLGWSTNALLTYKGPSGMVRISKPVRTGKGVGRRYKVRDEIELAVGDADQMRRILLALGVRPVFRYEKFRTTYSLPRVRDLKVEFDETPVGMFLELEGHSSSIDRAARLLGYSPADYLTTTYGGLYIAECRRRGTKPSNMLFQPTKNLR